MVPYRHQIHPRSRSFKIKIEPNGEVVVVTPPRYSKHLLEEFVSSHQDWILRNRAKMLAKTAHSVDTNQLSIFGKKYLKKILYTRHQPVGMSIAGQYLVYNPANPLLSPTRLETEFTKNLNTFLKKTAEKYLLPRTRQLAKTMKLSYGAITIREQKTRWGSCSSQGNLNFNWRLVHYEPPIIDYVIIHELAHLVHMNHSAAFWNLVKEYDPEYLKHRGWLKRHGLSVG
jgi:predicted metal-dependent hydrolase